MAEEEAIWYVIVKGKQQGPLTKAQVFEFLRVGTLVGSDLISCSGSRHWKSVSEINEFWRPTTANDRWDKTSRSDTNPREGSSQP